LANAGLWIPELLCKEKSIPKAGHSCKCKGQVHAILNLCHKRTAGRREGELRLASSSSARLRFRVTFLIGDISIREEDSIVMKKQERVLSLFTFCGK
jgi:hypothetical protein